MNQHATERDIVTLNQIFGTKKITKRHWKELQKACTSVIIDNGGKDAQYRNKNNIQHVLIMLPYWCKIAEDFPIGVVVARTEEYELRKINACKLLDWMHNNKYSEYDSEMLTRQVSRWKRLDNVVENLFDLPLDKL